MLARTVALLSVLCAPLRAAQFDDPYLTVLAPPGGRAGTTVPVVLAGNNLEEAALCFSHPGIFAKVDAKDAKKFVVAIAPDVPPGRYDVRAAGRNGISNPRVFEVGALPETANSGKNLDRENAQAVTLPAVVFGACQAQRIFWFKIPLAKGHGVLCDCHAAELDSRCVPLQIVYDAGGRELLRARETPLAWTATEDTMVFLAFRDYLSNGGAEHFFRLYLTEFTGEPKPPPPAEPPLIFWPPAGAPSAEKEPNDPAHPMPIVPPCEIQGQFFPAGDVDSFRFDAKKGDAWWLEVVSQRLGLPTNPRLVVQRLTKGSDGAETAVDVAEFDDGPAVPGAPDFDGAHLDPVGKFEAKEDGAYRISVRDLNNNSDDPRRRYTLSVRRETPDFALIAIPVPPADNKRGAGNDGPVIAVRAANLRPGETLPVRVLVLRRDGFKGDVKLSAENLPEGVSALASSAFGEAQDAPLFLRAAANAKAGSGALTVTGTATLNGKEVVHKARVATPVWASTANEAVEPARWRYASEFALNVVADQVFPTAVVADAKPVEAELGAKAKFSVKVTRNAEFKDALKLKPAGLAGLDKAKEFEIPAGAASAEYELDLAPLKLTPGTYTLWFKGQDKGKLPVKGKPEEFTVNVFSSPATLVVKEPPAKKGGK